MERKLTSTEVAFLVGVTPRTLEIWYRFKRENPDNEYSKLLPMYESEGRSRPRRWCESDIEKIIEFKEAIPHGRYGLFGSITHQTTYKKRKNHGKKESRTK